MASVIFALAGSLLTAQEPLAPAKTSAGFACNRLALDADARKRHFETLGPALRTLHQQIRELPAGYAFEFPSDPSTVRLVFEWANGERLCCPFFDIDLRFEHDNGGFWLRLNGPAGVKDFIKADFARWFQPR